MRTLFLPLLLGLAVSGCSKSEDQTNRETLGEEISTRMNAPIEEARAVTDKLGKIRATELPE